MLAIPAGIVGLEPLQKRDGQRLVAFHQVPGVTGVGHPIAIASGAVEAGEPEPQIIAQIGPILEPAAFVDVVAQRTGDDSVAAAFVDRPTFGSRVPMHVLPEVPPAIVVDVAEVSVRAVEERDVGHIPGVVAPGVGVEYGRLVQNCGFGRCAVLASRTLLGGGFAASAHIPPSAAIMARKTSMLVFMCWVSRLRMQKVHISETLASTSGKHDMPKGRISGRSLP